MVNPFAGRPYRSMISPAKCQPLAPRSRPEFNLPSPTKAHALFAGADAVSGFAEMKRRLAVLKCGGREEEDIEALVDIAAHALVQLDSAAPPQFGWYWSMDVCNSSLEEVLLLAQQLFEHIASHGYFLDAQVSVSLFQWTSENWIVKVATRDME